MTSCAVAGCEKAILARGLCGTHYQRKAIHGDPSIVVARTARRALDLPAFRSEFEALCEKVTESGCWIWMGDLDGGWHGGYGRYRMAPLRERRTHRLAWVLFNGPIPPGRWVLHRCDVPSCVNPAHLFLGDLRTNVDDMVAKGRQRAPQGEEHHKAKLTLPDVRNILASTESGAALARRLGVTPENVYAIRNRKTWRKP